MRYPMRITMLLGALLLASLTGCVTMPTGPSVMVLPTPGKPFEVFQAEDARCRHWAEQQLGMSPQENYTTRMQSPAPR